MVNFKDTILHLIGKEHFGSNLKNQISFKYGICARILQLIQTFFIDQIQKN